MMAQNTMRIHNIDGSVYEIPIEDVDSISFVEKDIEQQQTLLVGEWLWGNQDQGYYEVLTFNEDKTFTGYDNYFSYGFDTMTYGFYSQNGAMLTLWSNGFGYNRHYNWYVMGLSDNALEVMTKMGPFTYYKLQPCTIRLKVGESLACNEGESFIFADSVVAKIENEKLIGISFGMTYIEMFITASNTILAYMVFVE